MPALSRLAAKHLPDITPEQCLLFCCPVSGHFDTSPALPARDHTLILSMTPAHQLIPFKAAQNPCKQLILLRIKTGWLLHTVTARGGSVVYGKVGQFGAKFNRC